MADDIDSLLDEIEKAYIVKQQAITHSTETKTNSSAVASSAGDDEFGDILNDPFLHSTEILAAPSKADRPIENIKKEIRCCPVYIGGCEDTFGLSVTGNKRACSQLRCLNCDFNVSIFEHYKWSADTDYLFLRNHMPDFEKLSSNLLKQKGTRAYACQCSWKNVLELTDVRSTPDLKWICAKHWQLQNSC